MNRAPAFQFYAADWLSDERVLLMTLEEEGAYIRLLSLCWREGSIPADEAMLARLCKGASTTVVRVVAECFDRAAEDGSRLVHRRLEAERAKQAEWREKSSSGGKRSAAAKAKKRLLSTIDAVPRASSDSTDSGLRVVEPTYQPNGNTASSSLSLSINQEQQTLSPSAPRLVVPGTPFFEAWNSYRGKLPKALDLTDGRRKKASQLTKAGMSVDRFTEAVKIAAQTPFCRGENARGWKCSFDFLLDEGNVVKVLEGFYGEIAGLRSEKSVLDRMAEQRSGTR